MELTWFRRPAPGRPGTLNLCYNALDRHVVAGHADDVAVVEGDSARATTFARLLEQVAALAGGLRAVGLEPGQAVAVRLDSRYDALLVTLAAARLGLVTGDVAEPALLVTDRADPWPAPVRLLRGVAPTEPTDLGWDVVVGAGRQEPAACADLPGDALAYVVTGRTVSVADGVTDDSPLGWLLAQLCERRPVEL